MNKEYSITKWAHISATVLLLLVVVFWFGFALLSGAAEYGGGWRGVLYNSPNALPWLVLFGVVYVAWRWPLWGGALIALFGLNTLLMFDTYESIFTFLTITVPLTLLGITLMGSGYLQNKNSDRTTFPAN